MSNHLVTIVLLLVGLAAGWLTGGSFRRATSPDSPGPAAKSSIRMPSPAREPRPPTRGNPSFYDISAPLIDLLALNDQALINEYTQLYAERHQAGSIVALRLTLFTIAAELGRRSSDPGKTVLALREATPSGWHSYAALESWALRDPLAAHRYTLKRNLTSPLTNPLEFLAASDPKQAIALVGDIPDVAQRTLQHVQILGVIARTDFSAALTDAVKLRQSLRNEESVDIEMLFDGLGIDKIPAAIAEVDRAHAEGANIRGNDIEEALRRLASRDPVTAANIWLNSSLHDQVDPDSLLQIWAYKDPETTIAWVRAELPEDQHQAALESCLKGWTFTDPHASWSAINDPDSPFFEAMAIDSWAMIASAAHYDDRVETIRSILDGKSDLPTKLAFRLAGSGDVPHDLKERLVAKSIEAQALNDNASPSSARIVPNRMLSDWAKRSPHQAEALMAKLPPEQAEHALYSLATGMAKNAPTRAAALLSAQPDTPARNRAIQLIAAEWANRNPRAAADWVTSLPAGPTRDLAIKNVKTQGALLDPTLNDLR